MDMPLPTRQRSVRRRALSRSGTHRDPGCRLLVARCLRCSDSGKTTLVWYINPDAGGQDEVAENCSTDEPYTIDDPGAPAGREPAAHPAGPATRGTRLRHRPDEPRPAVHRRVRQRRLPGADIPSDVQDQLKEQSFKGAVDAATWNDQLVVFPFWSNTQVLWYRKSFAEKAGLDMSQPVTLGPDHRRGRRQRRQRSPSRRTSTRATSSGSTR